MASGLRRIVLVCAALALAACDTWYLDLPGFGGRVIDGATGAPIGGATVTYRTSVRPDLLQTETTGPDGIVDFSGYMQHGRQPPEIKARNYSRTDEVRVDAPGYRPLVLTVRQIRSDRMVLALTRRSE